MRIDQSPGSVKLNSRRVVMRPCVSHALSLQGLREECNKLREQADGRARETEVIREETLDKVDDREHSRVNDSSSSERTDSDSKLYSEIATLRREKRSLHAQVRLQPDSNLPPNPASDLEGLI